jgi:hypothetical protein
VVVPADVLANVPLTSFDRALLTAFGPGNVLAAETNGTFTANQITADGRLVKARLYNPGAGNPTMVLTYTSFIDVTSNVLDAQGQPTGERQRLYLPFGVVTAAAALPRAGSATYNGVAFGSGSTSSTRNIEFTGTSTLKANFGDGSFTAALNLTATGNAQAFAPFNFQGQIATNGFFGNGVVSPLAGQVGNAGRFDGRFFGPNADEFGAAFDIIRDDANGRTFITGVTVGRKD